MQPLPITINIVKVQKKKRYDRYNAIAARVLGGLQIALGVASIVFNVCAIVYAGAVFAFIGYGIWLPVFWFISGAFGITASFRKTKCVIITTMIMSILSASFMSMYVCLASFQMVEVTNDYYDYYDCDHDYDYYYDRYNSDDYDCHHRNYQYAMGSMMLVVAVTETIVAILTAVLCCRAVCCGQPHRSYEENRTQNIVMNTHSGAQTVSIPAGYQVTNQGATGHQVVYNTRNDQLAEDKPEIPPPYTVSTGYQRDQSIHASP